jgi:hypothetical protein
MYVKFGTKVDVIPMLSGSLDTEPWRVLKLQMKETDGTCEYNEKVVADNRRSLIIMVGDWMGG